MRKLLIISAAAALPVLLAATALATRGGGDNGDAAHESEAAASPRHTSTTMTSPATATPPADTSMADDSPAAAVAAATPVADEAHYLCPDGGIDEVIALQDAVAAGHQPWRNSAPDVAAACTLGGVGTSVEPAGANRYRVTLTATGESAIVEVTQPLGPDGIWVVTSVTPSTTPAAASASCTPQAILPAVRQALEASGVVHIAAVTVEQCQNGYARVFAVPDSPTCGQPAGTCVDNEQVFLTVTANGWSYLTSGTGINCATDDDLGPTLTTACESLGLR
jgi:hypothetical protein